MKKTIITIIIAGVFAISALTGCSSKPSKEQVQDALENGTLTTEDALEKGYISKDDLEPVEATDTVEAANKLAPNENFKFTATTLNGEAYEFLPSEAPTLVVFLHSVPEDTNEFLTNLSAQYADIKAAGGDALLILMNEDLKKDLEDFAIPTILYNKSIAEALGNYEEMVMADTKDKEISMITNWNCNGTFIYAWQMNSTNDPNFVEQTQKVIEMYQNTTVDDDSSNDLVIVGSDMGD